MEMMRTKMAATALFNDLPIVSLRSLTEQLRNVVCIPPDEMEGDNRF